MVIGMKKSLLRCMMKKPLILLINSVLNTHVPDLSASNALLLPNIHKSIVLYDLKTQKTLKETVRKARRPGRPRKNFADRTTNKCIYVKFNKNQKKYLINYFKCNNRPDTEECKQILEELLKLSYKSHPISVEKVQKWFRNTRTRGCKGL